MSKFSYTGHEFTRSRQDVARIVSTLDEVDMLIIWKLFILFLLSQLPFFSLFLLAAHPGPYVTTSTYYDVVAGTAMILSSVFLLQHALFFLDKEQSFSFQQNEHITSYISVYPFFLSTLAILFLMQYHFVITSSS